MEYYKVYYNGIPIDELSDLPKEPISVTMEVKDNKIILTGNMSTENGILGISEETIRRVINDESNMITEHFELLPPTEETKARLKKVLEIRAKCRKE